MAGFWDCVGLYCVQCGGGGFSLLGSESAEEAEREDAVEAAREDVENDQIGTLGSWRQSTGLEGVPSRRR